MAHIRYGMLLAILLLAGCSEMPATYAPNEEELAKNLQAHAETIQGVEEAHVYITEPYAVVALNISALQRYRKSKIEASLTKHIEQEYPQFEPIVSADRKLHFELAKMSFQQPNEIEKRFRALQELLKEET